MPSIPIPRNTVGATTDLPTATADSRNFGGQVGAALQDLGAAGERVGAQLTEKYRAEEASNAVAQFDYSGRMIEAQNSWGDPSGKGFAPFVKSDYDHQVDEHLKGITDANVRSAARTRLLSNKPGIVAGANKWEADRRLEWGKEEANKGLMTQENRVRTDPTALDQAIADSDAVIDGRPDLPTSLKPQAKRLQSEKLVRAHFEALTESARTATEVQGVLDDLSDPEKGWQSRMNATDFDKTVDTLKSLKKTVQTENRAQARSAVDTLKPRNNDAALIDPAELAGVEKTVRDSGDAALMREFSDIKATQDIYRRYPGLKPSELRAKAQEFRSGKAPGLEGVPGEVADAINRASQATGIPASYLSGVAYRESKYDPTAKARTSSATGLFQVIDGTWLQVIKGNGGDNARLAGIDVSGKSDAELLALRSDPFVNSVVGALYAKQNALVLSGVLGRTPTDGELYAAHFLGGGGAAAFYRALNSDPDAPAASVVQPEQVAANARVFYRGGDKSKPYTVAELAANFEQTFATSPGRAAFVQSEAFDKMVGAQATALKEDPMGYVARQSRSNIVIPEFSAENAQAYGRAAQAVAEYYEIPMQDFKPLRAEDAEQLARQVKDGTSEEAVAVMSQLRSLGGDVAKAAYKQIGQADKVFGFAAGLAHAQPANAGVAADIMRGQKRIQEDPQVLGSGNTKDDFRAAFESVAGRALASLDPVSAGAAFDAALAHYVESYVVRGAGKLGGIDQSAFENSINSVLGGSAAAPMLGKVNGETTILPAGVTAFQFEQALERFKPEDYMRMSKDGIAPRFADGSPILPSDIAREAKFRAIGGGEYRVQMGDGKYAMSTPNRFYIFKPKAEDLIEATQPSFRARPTQQLMREPWRR